MRRLFIEVGDTRLVEILGAFKLRSMQLPDGLQIIGRTQETKYGRLSSFEGAVIQNRNTWPECGERCRIGHIGSAMMR